MDILSHITYLMATCHPPTFLTQPPEPPQSLCSQSHQSIHPPYTHSTPTSQKFSSVSLTHTHCLPARLAFLSYPIPTLQHTCTHSSPTQLAPAFSPTEPRSRPFFHLPLATHNSLLCGAARPVYGSGAAGGGRQAPGRPAVALGGRERPAGGRWPGGAPGGSVGYAEPCDSAHRA